MAEDMYGEVSFEARKIVRDVELLGYDFLSALRNLTVTTPSDSLRAFIQGAVTTTLSGGEMGDYFVNKTRDYLQQNRKKFEDFLTTLGMITEVYIVGLVAAPLFIIVLYTAMLMLKGASPTVLFFVVYGVIPLGSILFIVLVDAITPEGSK
jgi:flagellar protein FlaJ